MVLLVLVVTEMAIVVVVMGTVLEEASWSVIGLKW